MKNQCSAQCGQVGSEGKGTSAWTTPIISYAHLNTTPLSRGKRRHHQVLVEPRGFLGTNELCIPEEFYL